MASLGTQRLHPAKYFFRTLRLTTASLSASARHKTSFSRQMLLVHQLEHARLDWQKARAELQLALAELEGRVAAGEEAVRVAEARDTAARRQKLADELLQRYITHIGKC